MSPHGLNLTDDVFGHGALFIISAVIAGGSFGELIAADFGGKSTWFKVFRILAGGATGLALLANTAGYMTVADRGRCGIFPSGSSSQR